MRRFILNTCTVFCSLIVAMLVFGGLFKVYDKYAVAAPKYGNLLAAGVNTWNLSAESVQLYPYTGWHLIRDFTATNDSKHVVSGDHGFYIDFDLDHPPTKEKDEFRIILIGGSAAQGFHGTRNERMFYRLLEAKLQKTFADRRVRIINMAMGSSTTYQNFIALNLWGHKLEPDVILTYSGRNDYEFLGWQKNQAYYRFESTLGLSMLGRVDKSPRWLKFIHDAYPNSIHGTDNFSLIVRLLNLPKLTDNAIRDFNNSFGYGLPQETYRNVILDAYVNALKSIKRDFRGIPILVVYQPWRAGAHYDKFRADTQHELAGYINHDWFFLDLQQIIKEKDLFSTILVPNDDCHASDVGHEIVTKIMEPFVTDAVRQLISRQSAKKSQRLPVSNSN